MIERHLKEAASPTQAYRTAAEIAPNLLKNEGFWKPSDDLKGILIVGKSGTGKTTLAELLGIVYGIPRSRVFKIGELLRTMQGVQDSLQIIDRQITVDQEMDDIQKNLIRDALTSDPFIIEGRLANVWLSEAAKKDKGIKDHVKSLLIAAPDEVAHLRLSKRAQGRGLDEVAALTNARAMSDANRWFTEAHPHLGLVNPYDPESFDFIVDANKDIPGEFYLVHNWLAENGLIRPVDQLGSQQDMHLPAGQISE